MSARIHWTEKEKHGIACKALDIQHDHPDLAGVALLRAAMTACKGQVRKRKIRCLSEAEWFEADLEAEAQRRASLARESEAGQSEDLLPVLESNRANTLKIEAHTQASATRLATISQALQANGMMFAILHEDNQVQGILLQTLLREMQALRVLATTRPCLLERAERNPPPCESCDLCGLPPDDGARVNA